jgi:hypothetical protein
MAEATEEKVLGNFNDATFTYAGTTSTFPNATGDFGADRRIRRSAG